MGAVGERIKKTSHTRVMELIHRLARRCCNAVSIRIEQEGPI